MISVIIKADENAIYKDILKEVKLIINRSIPKIQSALNKEIKNIILKRLTTGVPSISGKDLQEIGVPDINNRLVSVIRLVAENTFVKVSQDGASLLKIEIGILQDNYQDLLSLPEAVFEYRSSRGSGILTWLKWLLLDGGGQIIRDYSYNPAPSRYSRTQGGLMIAGGSWSVPSNLAGTQSDNILTKALVGIDVDIEKSVERILKGTIK